MHCTTMKGKLSDVTKGFQFKLFTSQQMNGSIIRALDEAKAWHKKACVLNATVMMNFVLLMGLRRELSYTNLSKELVTMFRDRAPEQNIPLKPFTNEALIKARHRLGSEPLRLLFESNAEKISPRKSFMGFSTYGIDGVHFTMPDTPENEERFKRPVTHRGGIAAFPKLKLVNLVSVATHQIRATEIGQHNVDERKSCKRLLSYLGKGDLLYLDSGIAAAWLFREITSRDIQFVSRIALRWRPTFIAKNGPGDYLVELSPKENIPGTLDSNGRYKTRRVKTTVRLIEYKTQDNDLVRLATSLLDSKKYPAREVALSYHHRWETELTYDEIKTHLFSVKHGTLHTNFRSKTPDGVEQEIYSMLTVYNFLRSTINEAAKIHHVNPLHISFSESVHVIQKALERMEGASPAQIPVFYKTMLSDIADCKLKRPRRKRWNPRRVKTKMSNYQRKKHGEHGEKRDFKKQLVLLETTPVHKKLN